MNRTVAIIGAGPIGLAAAHGAITRGYTPVVFERNTPGASLSRFGATKFFSPASMNIPPALMALAAPEHRVAGDAILTGAETARVLQSIAQSPVLAKHVLCNHRVIAVVRHNLSRGDQAGHPVRAELPFRIVVRAPSANKHDEERVFEADAVLDASGIYQTPVPIFASRVDASRENTVISRAIRDLGALDEQLSSLAGQRILLVGHGHSAANAITLLEGLAEKFPTTRVTWALRSRNLRPLTIVPSDPLPERDRVVTRANLLASKPPPWLSVERAATCESFEDRDKETRVTFSGARSALVDAIVWLTGYRPDLSFVSELPLEISPATEGAMRLSRALANVTDCLSVPKVNPEDLASGEPRFHLVGAKSYGRARTFLLQTGYAQLETILDSLFAV